MALKSEPWIMDIKISGDGGCRLEGRAWASGMPIGTHFRDKEEPVWLSGLILKAWEWVGSE